MTTIPRHLKPLSLRGLVAIAWAVGAPPATNAQEVAASTSQRPLTGTADLYVGLTPSESLHPLIILSATARRLRIEGRYNYEDVRTASLFAGIELATEGGMALWVAPMIGLVVGHTDGIAPALEIELSLGRFTLYDESEVVIPLDDESESSFYTWGTLTYRVSDGVQAGLSFQRLRVFESALEVDRGLAVLAERARLGASLYAFNPFDSDNRFFQLGLSLRY